MNVFFCFFFFLIYVFVLAGQDYYQIELFSSLPKGCHETEKQETDCKNAQAAAAACRCSEMSG